jgi:hypothetical protein
VRSDDGRKVAGAAQKRNRHGLLIEGYVWRPFLPGCDWLRFEKDFATHLGRILQSPPVEVTEPLYDQFDHEGTSGQVRVEGVERADLSEEVELRTRFLGRWLGLRPSWAWREATGPRTARGALGGQA